MNKTKLPPNLPLEAYVPAPNGQNERHAQALADIRAMHDELNTCHETIGQLRADLHRAEDRVVLLNEERDRYRDEAHLFRSKLIELATQQTNIGLLTIKAQEIMSAVKELTDSKLPSATFVEESHEGE